MLLTNKAVAPSLLPRLKREGGLTRVTCPEAEDRLDPIRGLSCPPRKWVVIEPFVAASLTLAAILRYLQHPIITLPAWC